MLSILGYIAFGVILGITGVYAACLWVLHRRLAEIERAIKRGEDDE